MKTHKLIREFGFLVLHLIPFVYLWLIYATLPEMVPIHFNIQGEADGFGKRENIVWMLLALNGIGYLLFLLIPLVDSKKFATTHEKIYTRIRIGITLLFVGLSVLMVYLTTGDALVGIFVLGLIFALLCIFLGNYLQAVKPNYFIGIRTPWTLNSETNWRKTHLVTGRILFYGGILSLPSLFLLPENMAPIGSVAVLVCGTVYGLFYSFFLHRKEKKEIS